MQIIDDASGKKKPMQIVEKGDGEQLKKRKFHCFCGKNFSNDNCNDPNQAIYLGFAEGHESSFDEKPVFIHRSDSCVTKARKMGILDKSGKFIHCIVCGHRVNLSEKALSEGGTIKQNGYLVDTKAWIHKPLPLPDYHPWKKKYEEFVISSCYEKAFGHSNFPPDDILSKREEIIEKYVTRNRNPTNIQTKNKKKNSQLNKSKDDESGIQELLDIGESPFDDQNKQKNLNKEKFGFKDAPDAFPVIFAFLLVVGQVLIFVPLMILSLFEDNLKIGKKYFWLFAIVMIIIIVIILEQADK